ncbi:hypothetical protein WJX72_004676 [[Myrmecia] bisecta]|uniref:Uncharacterized protein n=1 Tax=[Myrmecia] bisecta TaxID=41462 RepID=A0AAW1PFE1_9CHLO
MEGGTLNVFRTLRLGCYGVTLDGPLGHFWYKLLDRYVYPNDQKCTAAVLIKTAADQLVWAPVMTCVFFAVLKSLEGHPELIMDTIQDKLLKTLIANYVLWPLAHFINFRFVPSEHRILYNNAVAVVWNAYLSTLSHQPTIDVDQLLGIINNAQDVLSDWVPDVPESLAQQLGIPTQQIFDQLLPGAELPSIPPLTIPKQFTLGPSPKNIFGWLNIGK